MVKRSRSRIRRQFTLEYWKDDNWYVGLLKEVPGVMSQGQTLEELQENIQDAYTLVLKDCWSRVIHSHVRSSRSKSIPICVPA
jgi:predicted RNase H-like HicB family nuclease